MNLPRFPFLSCVALVATAYPAQSLAQIALTADAPYVQKFNVIGDKLFPADLYPWINDSTLPGWYASVNGKAPDRYRTTKGSQSVNPPLWVLRNDGNDASLGLFRGTHRNGTVYSGAIGASFVNKTGKPVTELIISYQGEQWVHNTGGADRLDFQYSLDATSLITGKWTDFDRLDFTAPRTGAAAFTPINGDAAGNNVKIGATITGLSIAPGATFWLRWTDFDAEGEDQALAIDDFLITAK